MSRAIQLSVTNFLHHNGQYLFLHRHSDKQVDPNKLNGVGGRVDPGENYLQAAIRETAEETGYTIQPHQINFAGMVHLTRGYDSDWVMAFFKIEVDTTEIPLGQTTPDGQLLWIPEDQVLSGQYDVVDDLHYCFEDVVHNNFPFFISAQVGSDLKVIPNTLAKSSLVSQLKPSK